MANYVPPAPPPYQPTGQSNPYDFLNQTPTPSGGFGGGSKKARIIVVAGGALLLLIIGIIFASILSSSGSSSKEDYQKLAQQQTELIRVSAIGVEKARGSAAKNLAITSKLTIESSQSSILALAKKAKAKTDTKTLALGKDADTDKTLTTAEQTNRFDEVFIQKLTVLLSDYQKTLKSLHDQSTNTTNKKTLEQAYQNASLLMQNGKKE